MSGPGVGGGRGTHRGPDAILAQSELRDLRRRLSELVTVPIGGMLPAKLSAAEIVLYFDASGLGYSEKRWGGFAICNGRNGTEDWNGRFPRVDNSGASGTGGNDSSAHTHTTDIDHNHGAFTSDNDNAGTINTNGLGGITGSASPHGHQIDIPALGATVVTSSGASASDNRPAYRSVVWVQRVN